MKVEIEIQDKKGLNETKGKQENQDRAEEIISLMKKKLGAKYPVLYALIFSMKFVPVMEEILLETDGINIFYSPKVMVKKARQKNMKEVEYAYVHIMLHGLLQHYTKAEEYERNLLMHILMDCEVCSFMNKMNIRSKRDVSSSYINSLLGDMSKNSLRGMYRKVNSSKSLKDATRKTAAYLTWDDYKVWTRNRRFHTLIEIDYDKKQGGGQSDNKERNKKVKQFWDNMCNLVYGRGSKDGNYLMQVLTGGKGGKEQYGLDAGGEEEVVKANNNAQIDYMSTMRRFFKLRETAKENVESIDKAMYSWGMSMYEDVAFIEPEAESENIKMNTIVLAIDTSGSCYGDVMEQFLAETKELFRSLSRFDFKKFVVLQCDAQIQQVDTYKNVRNFPTAADFDKGTRMMGWGGTSFIPVFDYIKELEDNNDKVDCLIYLTDGYGDYPNEAPRNFKTYFVLDNDTYANYERDKTNNYSVIPDWVEVLKMKKQSA